MLLEGGGRRWAPRWSSGGKLIISRRLERAAGTWTRTGTWTCCLGARRGGEAVGASNIAPLPCGEVGQYRRQHTGASCLDHETAVLHGWRCILVMAGQQPHPTEHRCELGAGRRPRLPRLGPCKSKSKSSQHTPWLSSEIRGDIIEAGRAYSTSSASGGLAAKGALLPRAQLQGPG